jgi:hypothetical protein
VIKGKKTLIPTRGDHQVGGAGEDRLPTLRMLHHADLSRIGAATPCGLFTPRQTLRVGRLEPEFLDLDGGAPEPLADPCISREQLTLTWTGRESFRVASCGALPVELFRLDGGASPSAEAAPSGTVIAIGSRALLLLSMSSTHEGEDRLGLDGESEVMWALRSRIAGAAASDSAVLIHGESGVGKELVARAIHRFSGRSDAPRLTLNCAAIPEHLLESELFGHTRGAFTGADADRDGLFRAAGGGTLFLDEVGELPVALQSKLLRALEERAVRAVGAVSEVPVDARVIAATNRDLRREVARGRFREDLYYRLSTLEIQVPPLRERREDIPVLLRRFLTECRQRHPELGRLWCPPTEHSPPLSASFVRSLLSFDWPGNVRHLRNVVERAAVANIHTRVFTVPEEVAAELRGDAAVDEPASAAADPRAGDALAIDDKGLLGRLSVSHYYKFFGVWIKWPASAPLCLTYNHSKVWDGVTTHSSSSPDICVSGKDEVTRTLYWWRPAGQYFRISGCGDYDRTYIKDCICKGSYVGPYTGGAVMIAQPLVPAS